MNIIQQKFNQAAHTYNNHNQLQMQVGVQLIDLVLQFVNKANFIIDLGCGTGQITQHLIKQLNHQRCFALDIAESCLTLAKSTLPKSTKLLHQDFNQISERLPKFDLVFANLSLHWSNDITTLFKSISTLLSSPGYLAFTIPLQGTLNTLRQLNPKQKHAFHTYEEICLMLKNTNLTLICHKTNTFTFNFNTAWQALKSLKKTGTNHLPINNPNRLNQISHVRKFIHHPHNTPCDLTYEIGFFMLRRTLKSNIS